MSQGTTVQAAGSSHLAGLGLGNLSRAEKIGYWCFAWRATARCKRQDSKQMATHVELFEKGLRTRVQLPPAPPYKKARKISGPFLLPEIPNPRGVAGIEAAGTNLPEGSKTPDFLLSPVSFLCFAAGTIGLNSWFFNGLARPFCFMSCRPVAQNKPVTHQTAPPTRVVPASQRAADCAETTTGSCTEVAFRPRCSG